MTMWHAIVPGFAGDIRNVNLFMVQLKWYGVQKAAWEYQDQWRNYMDLSFTSMLWGI